MGIAFIFLIVGVVLGVILSLVTTKPFRAFDEGFDAAKNMYSDWSQGFDDGFIAGTKLGTDYEKGFTDGWKAATKEEHSDECNDSM